MFKAHDGIKALRQEDLQVIMLLVLASLVKHPRDEFIFPFAEHFCPFMHLTQHLPLNFELVLPVLIGNRAYLADILRL